MRLRQSDVLPEVAEVLNLNPTSPKALRYLNRAQEELLDMGRWVGTTMKFTVCTTKGFITWPRELETIEALSINGRGTQLQNQWYQFQDYGVDYRGYYSGGGWSNGYMYPLQYGFGIDQAEAISFDYVCAKGNPKKLKVYGTATEAAGARILLQFYDGEGNYVRTNDGIEGWVDGEFVAINPTTPQTTINAVTSWVGVQKPVTNGIVRITELDTVTNLERLLAVYEPGETNPAYRRTLITGFCGGCGSSDSPVSNVTVIGSQRYIPAVTPRDYLCIASKPALIRKAKAIYLMDNNNEQQSLVQSASAFDILDKQLCKWTGGGDIQTPRWDASVQCQSSEPYYI